MLFCIGARFVSTAAPLSFPVRSWCSASFAASNGNLLTSVRTGTFGASVMKFFAVATGQVGDWT